MLNCLLLNNLKKAYTGNGVLILDGVVTRTVSGTQNHINLPGRRKLGGRNGLGSRDHIDHVLHCGQS